MMLSPEVGRIIVDRTGFTEKFGYRVDFAPVRCSVPSQEQHRVCRADDAPQDRRPRLPERPVAPSRATVDIVGTFAGLGLFSKINLHAELQESRLEHTGWRQPRGGRRAERLVVAQHGRQVHEIVDIEADVGPGAAACGRTSGSSHCGGPLR